ncbi:hypothetical protein LTS07_006686 [Exophiala sideris]|uniref:Uncharacterized protein n=1 Tax=Exophiala sideris TaxID=1016849 RepID=A0ABR0J957_9EURO|nr:hypothetical protein LTS07_006686 [Exophiala sideris]KAK5037601.1 hypothetical protein LTR13_004760 [Exophiala sideris]KAK5059263.1 hypothetical protein LTR69_006553 [Exophiala sideris]KAK5183097.1 hypothetical protein LTR44_004808 [Eurotiomycetes sp. CCFEE 6388]
MDVVNHLLLADPQGLPLGLLSAKFRVAEFSYLWSPDFYAGFRGFSKKSTRAKIGGFILICSLLALLSGSSVALLLTPIYNDYWPGGGCMFWLEDKHKLWPVSLDGDMTGGQHCNSPDPALVSAMFTNTSGCVWNGYPYLAEALKEGHMQTDACLVVDDGVLKRGIPSVVTSYADPGTTTTGQVRAWALSSNMMAGLYSSIIADAWWKAILLPSSSLPVSTRNMRYRARNATQVWVDTPIPVARSQCIYTVSSGLVDAASSEEQAWLFPVITTYPGRSDSAKLIQVPSLSSNKTTMRWIGNSLDLYPGALAFIQIPAQSSNTSGITLACFVDTHWVNGTNTATGVAYNQMTLMQTATLQQRDADIVGGWQGNNIPYSNTVPTSYTPGWTPVLLGTDWLNNLTPTMEEGLPGRTTLALALDTLVSGADVGAKNASIASSVATLLATQIVDGMSRLGYSENAGQPSDVSIAWSNVKSTWDNNEVYGNGNYTLGMLQQLLTGKGNLKPQGRH